MARRWRKPDPRCIHSFVLDDPEPATIFHDKLLSASLVVEDSAGWWIVPNVAGGWHRRLQLNLSDEARRERLTVANVDQAWLGIE